ncbi:hypothetical protein EMCRGX_G016427 [Ephydatia muelleri]
MNAKLLLGGGWVLDTAGGSSCPYCPDIILDPLGHHAQTWGLCGYTAQTPEGHFGRLCCKAHLPVRIEVGYGLGRVKINFRPADILIQGWDRGHPAAFGVTVTSPLTPATLNFSAVTEGAAAQAAEERKHASNDAKCEDLGWTCIPLAVESYGNWVTSPLNPLHIVEAGISPGAAAKATEERKDRNNDAKCEELGWRCIPMVVESYGCWGTEARQALSQLAS